MAEVATRDIPLNWDVFVTPDIPVVISDLPPGMKQRIWSPISATLIYGQRDAVLVDALLTVEQAHALVDWIAASGKNLTTIYVTHGHGDHFFGIAALDTIESLNPRAVIAGHKKPGKDDSPGIIEETRQYIRDFDRIAKTSTTARELYDKMLELYPDRANPGSLWGSARAVKG
jgi:glyoxylase-like metal-dependent hydrolase (beta-lactamase superfamily II)